MAQQLRPSKPADKQPKIDWSRRQEAENFAETVKLFRQGKIDPDMFRRFRLQHGAYGTRMTDCLLYTSPSPRDGLLSRMPSSA